jgi:hypothetical protein
MKGISIHVALRAYPVICVVATIVSLTLLTGASPQWMSISDQLKRPIELVANHASLPEILNSLSERYGINIVADGLPLRKSADFDFHGTLAQALDSVAEAFDYTWSANKSGAILMNKRFRNRAERPQMNLLELRQTAKDELTALSWVQATKEHDEWVEMIRILAENMTPAQVEALRSGKRLNFGDLLPQQQELLTRIILTRGFGVPRGVWAQLLYELDNLEHSSLEVPETDGTTMPPGRKSGTYNIWLVARGKKEKAMAIHIGQLTQEENR